jgi:hypothetical protein
MLSRRDEQLNNFHFGEKENNVFPLQVIYDCFMIKRQIFCSGSLTYTFNSDI